MSMNNIVCHHLSLKSCTGIPPSPNCSALSLLTLLLVLGNSVMPFTLIRKHKETLSCCSLGNSVGLLLFFIIYFFLNILVTFLGNDGCVNDTSAQHGGWIPWSWFPNFLHRSFLSCGNAKMPQCRV